MTAPTAIGRYEVLRELGKGAMGTVYLARDTALERLVALKTFRFAGAETDLEDSAVNRRRTLREAQRAGVLSHPNVITIFDLVEAESGSSAYIVMEYVEGTGLDARLRQSGPLTLAQAAPLVAQIASALDHLHARGIVHRDVKPGNVLVTEDGRLKITDFGVARTEDPAHTLDSEIYGTPYYMSPEQIQGQPLDGRSDVFSLGVLIYEMLTGRRPFPGTTVAEVAHRIVYEPGAEPTVDGKPLPGAAQEVLAKALAKDPAERFATAGALATAVQQLAEGSARLELGDTTAFPRSRWGTSPPPRRPALPRPPLVLAAALALVLVLVAAGVAYVRWQRGPQRGHADGELQARQIGYVKLVTEGRRLLDTGDPQGAALLFQAAEGLAIDPAGARRLRDEAEHRAEEQGAHLQLLDARQALSAGRYDEVIATARQMMATRSGREKAEGVLADVQDALARSAAAAAVARPAPPPSPLAPIPAPIAAVPTPTPLPGVDYGVLRVELRSQAPKGVLTVWVDDRQVLREPFEFYQRDGLFRRRPVPGSWATDLTVKPGRHALRVLVARSGEKAVVATLETPIEAGTLRTLSILVPPAGDLQVELR
ncbi:MAG TPA: protein kinase [Thermoanaerobaculia bacterium]|nr:protein kinase [Thermoanaerobaculia bacterium]